MGLVDYGSDDDQEDQSQNEVVPRVPLPARFHDIYHTPPRAGSEFHNGRVRTMPHIEGKWPSHVYFDWTPTNSEYALLSRVTDLLHIESLVINELGVQLPLHISLSDTLMLDTEDREPFMSALNRSIVGGSSPPLRLRLQWPPIALTNATKTRTFIALRVHGPHAALAADIAARVSTVCRQFDQPVLESHVLHVSIGWVEGAVGVDSVVDQGGALAGDGAWASSAVNAMELVVDGVKARIGRQVHFVPLQGHA
uniref:U6 snRNA phosphodiesterase 1 n=1 Tax=Blastobotrys adeninivorans TaxID=409370 RepID=A0A060T325_BLAAD